jgi:hypothetical protein
MQQLLQLLNAPLQSFEKENVQKHTGKGSNCHQQCQDILPLKPDSFYSKNGFIKSTHPTDDAGKTIQRKKERL